MDWREFAPLTVPPPSATWGYKSVLDAAEESLRRLDEAAGQLREAQAAGSKGSDEEGRRIAKGMLPILDSVERILALASQQEDVSEGFQNWLKSVEAVQLRLSRFAEQVGLALVPTLGQTVDLNLHDVVLTQVAPEYPEGTIIEERQKGYYFRGKLLRDAKVVVAMPR